MKKRKEIGLEFEIDKLTNSIENIKSGDSFPTEISLLTTSEVKALTKKNGWKFNWASELKIPAREVYKLIEHYEKTLGAIHFGGQHMIITTEAALKLVNTYFK